MRSHCLAAIAAAWLGVFAAAPSWSADPAANSAILIHKMLYRSVDTIAAQINTQSFVNGSNFRVTVMPANAPDVIMDIPAFVADSTPLPDPIMRVVLPPGTPGSDEIRVYYIPQFGSTFQVGARMPVQFGAGAPGAMSLHQMTLLIAKAGLDRFLADYKERTWALEGQFGGSVTNDRGVRHVGVDYEDVTPDQSDPDRLPTQVLCEMSVKQPDLDARIDALRKGDDVVLIGHGATLKDTDKDAFLVHDCVFAN